MLINKLNNPAKNEVQSTTNTIARCRQDLGKEAIQWHAINLA